jgi:hypothetical protein
MFVHAIPLKEELKYIAPFSYLGANVNAPEGAEKPLPI